MGNQGVGRGSSLHLSSFSCPGAIPSAHGCCHPLRLSSSYKDPVLLCPAPLHRDLIRANCLSQDPIQVRSHPVVPRERYQEIFLEVQPLPTGSRELKDDKERLSVTELVPGRNVSRSGAQETNRGGELGKSHGLGEFLCGSWRQIPKEALVSPKSFGEVGPVSIRLQAAVMVAPGTNCRC